MILFAIPKLYNGGFTVDDSNLSRQFTQVNTPFGIYHVKRFPMDAAVLSYIDGYNRFVDITYVDEVIGLSMLKIPEDIEIPLGFGIVVNKILRGKYLPPSVEDEYSTPATVAQDSGISMDTLRVLSTEELTAISAYYLATTETETEKATEESITTTLGEDLSVLLLFNNYYPLIVYQKSGDNFFAFDPVLNTDKAFLQKLADGSYTYKVGLLTYTGGDIVRCLDTLG
jgi:hypothetical protein